MSAVLRAYGVDFDVDAFLAGCTLSVCAVFRRGEPVVPATRPNGRRHERSGIHIVASDAGFHEFQRQVEEASTFLRDNQEQLRRLCTFPGVEGVSLDFGIARRNVAVQCDCLPADLIRLAATLGLSIEVSQYPAEETTEGV